MKKTFGYLLLLVVLMALSSCATKREVMLNVDKDRVEEAWEKARKTAGTHGYLSKQHDIKEKTVHFYKQEVDVPLPMNLHIFMNMDTSEEEKPVLRMEGKDEDLAGEDDQAEADMNDIAKEVQRCCGVYEEEEEKK